MNSASINNTTNNEIEFNAYNIKGEKKWTYTTPFRISLNYYNAVIYQVADKRFLIELYDAITKEIHRILIDEFEIKWQTTSLDTAIKNQETLNAFISSYQAFNVSNNPSSNFNNDKENIFYKIQPFYKTNDTTYPIMTNFIYGINLLDGSTQKHLPIDSFALPSFYNPNINGSYPYENYYGVTFFKVLPENKLFLETITKIKCDTNNLNSYLVIFGPTITTIKQNKDIESKLNIFPNPNNGIFIISYESKTNSNLQLQLIDVTGNIIYQENKQHQNKTEFSINQNNLAKGIYWIKLNDGNSINSRAIIVQ